MRVSSERSHRGNQCQSKQEAHEENRDTRDQKMTPKIRVVGRLPGYLREIEGKLRDKGTFWESRWSHQVKWHKGTETQGGEIFHFYPSIAASSSNTEVIRVRSGQMA